MNKGLETVYLEGGKIVPLSRSLGQHILIFKATKKLKSPISLAHRDNKVNSLVYNNNVFFPVCI